MNQQNVFPEGRFPPTNALAAAIKHLPQPGIGVPPQAITIDAGPIFGRFSVTFVVRGNADRRPLAWFWGVGSSERVADDQRHEELSDPTKASRTNISALARVGTTGSPPASVAAIGIFNRLQQIRATAAPVIGAAGVVALYERSRHLSSRVHPWLAVPEEDFRSGMDLEALRLLVAKQGDLEAAAGAGSLLKSLHEVLAGLVGVLLTTELIGLPTLLC